MTLILKLTETIAQLLKQQISDDILPDRCAKESLLAHYGQEILEAHLYLLCSHGKLVRPLLVALTAGCINGEGAVQLSYPAGLSIELVHTYSLLHDDLPCMDNDTIRRGQPTTHLVYGEAKALLVGDGLLTAAFSILSQNTNKYFTADLAIELIHSLSHACGASGLIFGQWLDISEPEFPPVDTLTESEKRHIFQTIHKNKTGKLFGACFAMGFACGMHSLQCTTHKKEMFSVTEKQKIQKQFYNIGLDIGLSFQITDDILDMTQNSETLGKTSGKDVMQNKWNAVKIFGLEKAIQYANQTLTCAIQQYQQLYDACFKQDQNMNYYQTFLEFVENLSQRKS